MNKKNPTHILWFEAKRVLLPNHCFSFSYSFTATSPAFQILASSAWNHLHPRDEAGSTQGLPMCLLQGFHHEMFINATAGSRLGRKDLELCFESHTEGNR